MANYIFVGDPHAVPQELEDCANLMAYAVDKAVEHKAKLCVMGDLHNTHAVVRVEVVNFWRAVFKRCNDLGIEVIIIAGNHDRAAEMAEEHILVAYEDLVTVVGDYRVIDNILFIAYQADKNRFVSICNEHKDIKTAVVHQTVIGAAYDNGFLAPDGFDQSLVPQEEILSGHIHSEGYVGESVHYLGSPRWRSLSDANKIKGIWLIDIVDGEVVNKEMLDTGNICRQILQHDDTEANPLTDNLLQAQKDHDLRVDIIGSSQYCDNRKLELAKLGIKYRVFKTQDKVIRVKESDGIDVALKGFFGQYQPKYVDNLACIKDMVRERLQINV